MNATTATTTTAESVENSTTYNVTPSSIEILFDVSKPTLVVLSILYGILSVTAVFGNLLVIFVILLNKKMRTRTNAFIVNLACADIVTGLWVIPFQFPPAVLYRWPFAGFLCPTMYFVKEICSLVSIYTLVAISIDRYLAICHPLSYKMPNWVAVAALLGVWLHAILTSWPWATFLRPILRLYDMETICFVVPTVLGTDPVVLLRQYYTYLFFLEYFIPLVILLITYSLIAHRIWMTKTPGDNIPKPESVVVKNKRKVLKMVFVIVILFMVCWLPLQLYQILGFYFYELLSWKHINIVWFFFNSLAMANSSVNPIVYGMLNENFKKEFKRIFRCRLTSRNQIVPDEERLDEIRYANGERRRTGGTISGSVFGKHQRENLTNSTVTYNN